MLSVAAGPLGGTRRAGAGNGALGSAVSSIVLAAIVGLLLVGCASDPADYPSAAGTTSSSDRGVSTGIRGVGEISGVVDLVGEPRPVDSLTAVADADVVPAFEEPDSNSEVVATFERDPTYPQYFLALSTFAEYQAQGDDDWLEVMLPIRPNGTTGWIRVDDVVMYQNRFRVEIDVSDRSLMLLERGETVFTTEIAIGTGETPTPIGSFFTTVLYEVPDPDGPYGPYAFALSGFSEVLTSFNGGDGLIGIHGTNDPGSLGTEVSHGCIRIPNDLITQMAEMVPLGTPVTIVE